MEIEGSKLVDLFDNEDIVGLLTLFHEVEQSKFPYSGRSRNLLQEEKSETLSSPSTGLYFGPLKKSHYTCKLVRLFRRIISQQYGHAKFEVTVKDQEYILSLPNKGKTDFFNISELLRFANLNHIVLNEDDMDKYELYAYQTTHKPAQAVLPDDRENGYYADDYPRKYPSKEYFKKLCKEQLNELTYAEKLAINVYTGDFYPHMNSLLRGEVKPYNSTTQSKQQYSTIIIDALVHSIMAISGLNKLTTASEQMSAIEKKIQSRFGETELYVRTAFRVEQVSSFAPGVLEERIRKAHSNTVEESLSTEKTFVSTTPHMSKTFLFTSANVLTFFVGLHGHDVTPLSYHLLHDEKEVLMPPTDISWVYHQEVQHPTKGLIHIFFAKPLRPLNNELTVLEHPKTCNMEVDSEVSYLSTPTIEAQKRLLSEEEELPDLQHLISYVCSEFSPQTEEEIIRLFDMILRIAALKDKQIKNLFLDQLKKINEYTSNKMYYNHYVVQEFSKQVKQLADLLDFCSQMSIVKDEQLKAVYESSFRKVFENQYINSTKLEFLSFLVTLITNLELLPLICVLETEHILRDFVLLQLRMEITQENWYDHNKIMEKLNQFVQVLRYATFKLNPENIERIYKWSKESKGNAEKILDLLNHFEILEARYPKMEPIRLKFYKVEAAFSKWQNKYVLNSFMLPAFLDFCAVINQFRMLSSDQVNTLWKEYEQELPKITNLWNPAKSQLEKSIKLIQGTAMPKVPPVRIHLPESKTDNQAMNIKSTSLGNSSLTLHGTKHAKANTLYDKAKETINSIVNYL